tara:strand:+ start:2429 stop:4108 length:1680 start_codon:yes stop_codon:yes gene_type:complete
VTPEQEKALKARLQDRYWRLNNLYWIIDGYGQKVRFKFNWAQELLFKDLHYLNEVLKVRQLGISTFMAIFMLDRCLFLETHGCGIVDKTEADVKKKIAKIKFAWENLDYDDGTPEGAELAAIGHQIKTALGIPKKNGQIDPVKSNDLEMTFSNNSTVWGGISLRGGTTQCLHISELGAVAFKEPKKAREILSGALNTVIPGPPGQIIVSESTHEGGKFGAHYDICELAMENIGRDELAPMQWKFHFYAWMQERKYRADPSMVTLKPRDHRYHEKIKNAHGITFTPEQAAWHSMKWDEQKEGMFKEYPTVPSEAFDALIKGSIYGETISALRSEGKILDFIPNPTAPVVTAWDIGNSDYNSIWFIQQVGMEFHWINWHESQGEQAGDHAAAIRKWEAEYGPVAVHLLPHDANTRGTAGSHKTSADYLADAGIKNVVVVPRTPDIWIAINALRDMLPRCVFHKTNCGTERIHNGKKFPSGLACLEGYHTSTNDAGATIKEMPVHDAFSHSADAARTFAQAVEAGLVQAYFGGTGGGGNAPMRKRKPRVSTGFRNQRNKVRR